MRFQSNAVELNNVSFPEFKGEKVYMQEFFKKDGLPKHLKRWQATIDQMLSGIETNGPIYLMIDEAFVQANKAHRRQGLHIDGYWLKDLQCHGNSGPSHSPSPKPRKKSWENATFDMPETILLASNIEASYGFIGEFNGPIGNMGDCASIALDGLKKVSLEANKVYAGNVTFLHESVPVKQNCNRTLVRLNIPGLKLV
jgi:hypothetical protein